MAISRKWKNVGRLSQIVNTLARYGFRKELQNADLAQFVENQNTDSESQQNPAGANDSTQNPDTDVPMARRLALAFEELGPTFVKLGQLLAAREDLLPKEVVAEFKRFQDRAKPFPEETLNKVLSCEYNGQVGSLFSSIDPIPLGAASIGQVHSAVLADGRNVVLKVQRPEIEATIRSDLALLSSIASLLENTSSELKRLKPTIIIEELRKSLQAELDYFREASNTERMRSFFENDPHIYIPEIHRDLCTRTVLCMEAIEGARLTALEPGPEHRDLVRIGVKAFLDMTFRNGFFHADLHPGNFIAMPNGKLAILDFGLTARMNRDTRNTLLLMFMSMVREDLDTFARLFCDLIEADVEMNPALLERDIKDILDSAMAVPLRDLQVGKLLMQAAQTAAHHHAPVKREMILFFRALVALESFGKSLDPYFDVLTEAKRYAKDMHPFQDEGRRWLEQDSVLFLRDSQAIIKEMPMAIKTLVRRLQAGPIGVKVSSEELWHLSREIDRASNRLSLALILGALVLGSSILTYDKQGRLFDSLATMGLIGFGVAGLLGVWLVIGIIRSGRFK